MKKREAKGLGTGLGALFGEDIVDRQPEGTRYLPIMKIEPRKGQPRTNFDDEKLAELAASISEHGVIQPLTVRELDNGSYQIIAGERRWRAARIAGLRELPVNIITADDAAAMEMAMVENLQREDLNPIEEALGYRKLIDDYGLTQEQTADKVAKSRPVIANALRLLTLPDKAVEMVADGRLSVSHARAILELEGDGLRLQAAEYMAEKQLTVREAVAYVKKLMAGDRPEKKREPAPDGVDYVAEAEKTLTKALGRKVTIKSGKKVSRLEIEFYGDEDFECLYSVLENVRLAGGGRKK